MPAKPEKLEYVWLREDAPQLALGLLVPLAAAAALAFHPSGVSLSQFVQRVSPLLPV